MYSLNNLIIYSEKDVEFKNKIIEILLDSNVIFKELHSLALTFSAIKNPQNHIIIAVKTKDFLASIENIAKGCHNYQNRIFIVFESINIDDYFFNNKCIKDQLEPLKDFILKTTTFQSISPLSNTSTLVYKLVELELKSLEISSKYTGFKYLTEILTQALSTNFYACDYIDFFQYSARLHSSTIDTIERDVRHMLTTSWKKNEKFRNIIQQNNPIENPKAKTILNAILEYLKNII